MNQTKNNSPKSKRPEKLDTNAKQKITINKIDRMKSQASFLESSALGFHSWKADRYKRRNFGPKTYRHSVYGFSTEHLAPKRN